MTAMLLLRKFWFAIPIALLVVALMLTRSTLASEKKAHNATKAVYAQFVADVKAKTELARLQDAATKARVEREQDRITKEVSSDYQEQLAALRSRADAMRVQLAAKANPGSGRGPAVPSVPQPARGSDEAPGDTRLSLEERLIASEQALRLKALQDWNRAQASVPRE